MTSPLRRLVCGFALATAVFAGQAPAQSEREVKEALEKIEVLRKKAEYYRRNGRMDQANEYLEQAKLLARRIDGGRKRKRVGDRDWNKIVNGLEAGISALRTLGMKEEAQHLLEIAHEVIRERQGGRERKDHDAQRDAHDRELAEARRILGVLDYARAAFDEAEKLDALDMIKRFMHAMELRLEGARGEKAEKAAAAAPKLGQVVELLQWSAKILDEYRAREKAAAVRKLAKMWGAKLRGNRGRERERNHKDPERHNIEHQLELMRYAHKLLSGSRRNDHAEVIEHAIHSLELTRENDRSEKAMRIRRSAPRGRKLAASVEVAAEIAADKGDKKHAKILVDVARRAAQQDRKRDDDRRHKGEHEREGRREKRERAGKNRRGRREREEEEMEEEEVEEELEEFQKEIHEAFQKLERRLQNLARQIEQLRRDMRRSRR